MPAPKTNFSVTDDYSYLHGLGSYHSSEALDGAVPLVNNSPQKPPYGLVTERISGSSFVAPRHLNLQAWLYRTTSTLHHSALRPLGSGAEDHAASLAEYTPNSYTLTEYSSPTGSDWLSQKLLAKSGDPMTKTGLAVWIFAVDECMPARTAFASLDGDVLIIPQSGALDIQTELGRLLVRQNEIAMIPRSVRYRVTLPTHTSPSSPHARGYIIELHQGHFRLPDLGAIGSTGLANVRDFQIPVAYADPNSLPGASNAFNASKDPTGTSHAPSDWTIVTRQRSRLWTSTQRHTPFDVAGWHGTYHPYKYDLARFCYLTNAVFDEHDPSLNIVLSAPGVADFAIFGPRWAVVEDTLWVPYLHRNAMAELTAPIVHAQDPAFEANKTRGFAPFVATVDGPMAAHGVSEEEMAEAQEQDLAPRKVADEGVSVFLLETELPLTLARWAAEAAVVNYHGAGEN